MTGHPSPSALPPDAILSDDAIELRLIRVLPAGDTAVRPPEARFLSAALEYRFAIHRRSDGLRVGRIHLRVTRDPLILRALGHSGYEVDETHRRNGYATRAIRLIVGLARVCNVTPLWVLIEPDNVASRKAVERAGFTLADVVDTLPEGVALGLGPRVCRYTTASGSGGAMRPGANEFATGKAQSAFADCGRGCRATRKAPAGREQISQSRHGFRHGMDLRGAPSK
jgi:predicted acetyltransferase